MTAQEWGAALDSLEQQVTAHRALLRPGPDVPADAAAWTPPQHLGSVPAACLPRARALLQQLEDVVEQLDRARTRTRQERRLHRPLPSAGPVEASYLDVRG